MTGPQPTSEPPTRPLAPAVGRVLITRDQIAARVQQLGRQIAQDVKHDSDTPIVIVSILTGAMIFTADLIRQMPLKMSLGLVTVSSYPGQSVASRGASIKSELPQNLADKHVLLIDDILDSGRTLHLVHALIKEQAPATLRTCVLLRKELDPRPVDFRPDYMGFDIPDLFVVGYGLDYDDHYRNLPDIAELRNVTP